MPALSIVIPCKDEEDNIKTTVQGIVTELDQHHIDFEIIVVSDGSMDETERIINELALYDPRIRLELNHQKTGFGYAVRKGLEVFQGDYVIITMADASDDPKDMVSYFNEVKSGVECCFGDRWSQKGCVSDYPRDKYYLNRLTNWFITMLFGLRYSDITNAFKCYSRETIEGIQPILSRHFNITVELPLKAIIRGFSYKAISTRWYNRKKGVSLFRIEEMGSRYFFIIIYVLMEKFLCGNDYKRKSGNSKDTLKRHRFNVRSHK